MLFCNRCGQCAYINDEQFIEYASVSGTETRYIDCRSGEVEDYGDTNTDSTGDSEYACPHCDSNDIEFDWDAEDHEEAEKRAKGLRESYTLIRAQQTREFDRSRKMAVITESEWDLESN